ncbi:MAG: circadian clock KaiB family protein [FCB group bacterium]|jgi:circadian clock protein KaiB|nr:circadian clock KaiB family protein [FCB group bacterium]
MVAQSIDRGTSDPSLEKRRFRLYVAGQTPNSLLALANIKKICSTYLHSPYEIEVVNVIEEAQRAAKDCIIAVPTLLQISPEPVRRIVGDLADTAHVLAELGLKDWVRCNAENPPTEEH